MYMLGWDTYKFLAQIVYKHLSLVRKVGGESHFVTLLTDYTLARRFFTVGADLFRQRYQARYIYVIDLNRDRPKGVSVYMGKLC